jgi:CHAD domain-containing protein
MKKKNEKVHFNDQWEQMMVHFKNFIKTGDQEQLHLFRVQVKKLRAMLELFDTTTSKKKLSKDFKPVRMIFKHCGEIRSAYINMKLGAQYHFTDEDFLMGQLYEIEKGTNSVKELEKKYLKAIKSAHNDIADDLEHIGNKTIVAFYKTKLDQVANILSNLQFSEDLHNARKQIKVLLYNRKIARTALEEGKLNISDEYLDKVQGLIGDWHDNILALQLFSAPELNHKPVITKIKRQDTRFKRSITALVHDFEKKAVITEKQKA